MRRPGLSAISGHAATIVSSLTCRREKRGSPRNRGRTRKRTNTHSATDPESPGPKAGTAGEPPCEDAAGKDEPQGTAADLELCVSDILEALPFYAVLVDGQHHILQANSAVRGQLGLDPEAIVGKYCPTVVHGLDRPWHACPLEEAADTGKPVEREAFDQESGRWIRSGIYPTGRLTQDGRGIYFHTISDITDRQQAE